MNKVDRHSLKNQQKSANEELQKNKNSLSGKSKRVTRQIRIDEQLHKKIKVNAIESSMTMSRYLDALVLFADKQGYPYK